MTHASHRECVERVGEVLDHTITEEGVINFYTIKWPDGSIDKDIPARFLIEQESHEH